MRASTGLLLIRSVFALVIASRTTLAFAGEAADDPPPFPTTTKSVADGPAPPIADAGHDSSKPAVVFPRPGSPPPAFTRPLIEPQVTSQTRQALRFYGGYAARTTLAQQPRRTPIQTSAARPLLRPAKPFQSVYREPTVSPYLNLTRDEISPEAVPTYLTLVRPQLDQIEVNRRQQRELQQLRGQLQSSYVGAHSAAAGGTPRTGTPARYMDTAHFYSGLQQ